MAKRLKYAVKSVMVGVINKRRAETSWALNEP